MVSLSTRRRLGALLLAVIVSTLLIVIVVSGGRAKAASETQPAGAELTPAAAEGLVVERYARQEGFTGSITLTTVRAVYAQALAVLNGQPVSSAVYGGALAQEETSPVYVVIMQAAAGSAFHPNVSVPPRQTGPSGPVMSVVVNADTGWKLAMNLEDSVPARLDEMGPELVTNIPATDVAAGAAVGAHSEPAYIGVVIGKLSVHGHATSGWKVVAAPGTTSLTHTSIERQVTNRSGGFTFTLIAGRYRLAAVRLKGGFCGTTPVNVRFHKQVHVQLRCI